MEDISKELEREIEKSLPRPFKRDRKKQVLIVDDFGTITSGEYLKKLIKISGGAGLVCLFAAVIFCYLYIDLSRSTTIDNNKNSVAQKKIDALIHEKEMLMARLVIMGEAPEVIENTAGSKDRATDDPAKEKKGQDSILDQVPNPKMTESQEVNNTKKPQEKIEKNKPPEPESSDMNEPSPVLSEPKILRSLKQIIAIENFKVFKDGSSKDLLVRFDIKNISTELGDVSGRIFTLLKPDEQSKDQWRVLPSADLKDGIPFEYKKGQYFSISHFKPVKFRIKQQLDPDLFKIAAIYIFNDEGDLIVEEHLDITRPE